LFSENINGTLTTRSATSTLTKITSNFSTTVISRTQEENSEATTIVTTIIIIIVIVSLVIIAFVITVIIWFRQKRAKRNKCYESESNENNIPDLMNDVDSSNPGNDATSRINSDDAAYINQPIGNQKPNSDVSVTFQTQNFAQNVKNNEYRNAAMSINDTGVLKKVDSSSYIIPETLPKTSPYLDDYEAPMSTINSTPELDGYVQPMKIDPFSCGSYIEFNSVTGKFETSTDPQYEVISSCKHFKD